MNVNKTSKMNVAIDGPAGAGKSTVARLVAERLGYVYVDTGAMYRSITLKAIREGVSAENAERIVELAERTELRLIASAFGQRVIMDGEDVTKPIRSAQVTALVSSISAIPALRQILVRLQQKFAADKGVVMDGRDIGTNVLPDAEVKVFLTASVRIRAERRYKELIAGEPDVTVEQLMETIAARDTLDSERKASPLRKAEDAIEIDTSDLHIEEVVSRILDLCSNIRKGEGP